jgi:hypothetical protein
MDNDNSNNSKESSSSSSSLADQAADAADAALTAAGSTLKCALRSALRFADSAAAEARAAADAARREIDDAAAVVGSHQDAAFATARQGVEHVLARPHLGYPLAAAALILALPPARRACWRATFGRLRSPQAVVESATRRVEDAATRYETLTQEARKLTAEAGAAEAELERARDRLKAARAALQRLGGQIGRAERGAESAARSLRDLSKPPPEALELRSKAAQLAKSLGQQGKDVDAAVMRAARWDV